MTTSTLKFSSYSSFSSMITALQNNCEKEFLASLTQLAAEFFSDEQKGSIGIFYVIARLKEVGSQEELPQEEKDVLLELDKEIKQSITWSISPKEEGDFYSLFMAALYYVAFSSE